MKRASAGRKKFQAIFRVWLWFIVLVVLYGLAFAVSMLMTPVELTRTVDVIADEASVVDRQALESDLVALGLEQVGVHEKPSAPNGVVHVVEWTETVGFLQLGDPKDIAPVLEAGGLKSGASLVQMQPKHRFSVNIGVLSLLALTMFIFVRRKKHPGPGLDAGDESAAAVAPGWRDYLIVIGSSMVLCLVISLVLGAATDTSGQFPNEWIQLDWQTVFVFVIIVPFVEEVMFRAWLLEGWRPAIGDRAALISSAILFAAIHGSAPSVL